MAKKKPKYNQEAAIRGALRRAFSRSPIVQEVMNESRREMPRYNKDGSRHKKNWVQRQCQVCDQWSSTSKMAVDHKIPVVSIEFGKQDWNEYIDRLWCAKDNLQRICDPCHDKKTNEERIARLKIKYTQELDLLEKTVASASGMRNLIGAATNGYKDLIKSVNKYIAKKKTIGLEEIVERAMRLKQEILILKTGFDK
jgi:5-methylcytosine-specific restriction endonuclease McrA